MRFKRHKRVLNYCKIGCYCIVKSFLSLSQITLLFPFYVRCTSTILTFLRDSLKLALFFLIFLYIFGIIFTSNKVFYFPQINLFFACSLVKIYHQSERKLRFYLAQNFRFFYFKNVRIFIQNRSYSLKVAVPGFENYKKKSISISAKSLESKHEHELSRRYFSMIVLTF